MSQTQNISTRNALARLSLGLSMLAYGTAKLSRNPNCNKGRMMVALGAMKAAEGTVKFCPLKAIMQQQGMTGQTAGPEVSKLMKDFAGQGMSVTT
ncbi:MAG TPA: YgaP-like transmembrane domain [Paenisporosarcina sp.]|nr:YgaP-like transmembrane domain [Paenisporosarcina sp.]